MHTSLSTYSGTDFLIFYAAAMLAAVIAGLWLPRFLRADGRDRAAGDLELAWLTARSGRVTETVLARLLGRDALEPAGSNTLRATRGASSKDPAEQAILRLTGSFGITEAHKALKPTISAVEAQLIDKDLVLGTGGRWGLRLTSILPYLAVLGLGWYRREAGLAEGEPVGILTIMMIALALLALLRFAVLDPRTRAGQDAVTEAQARSSRLRSAPTREELGLGVALFGTAVLVATPFSELHAMRQAASGDGSGGYSSDSGSGDGGSGGDGGGGCGGCGG